MVEVKTYGKTVITSRIQVNSSYKAIVESKDYAGRIEHLLKDCRMFGHKIEQSDQKTFSVATFVVELEFDFTKKTFDDFEQRHYDFINGLRDIQNEIVSKARIKLSREEELEKKLADFFKENCPIPGAKIIIIPGDAYERN